MGHWNHRVVKRKCVAMNEDYYRIEEAYYHDNEDIPHSITDGCSVQAEDVEGLKWVLEHMLKALDEPILNGTAIEEKFSKEMKKLEEKIVNEFSDINNNESKD